jgi:hypothetical protein
VVADVLHCAADATVRLVDPLRVDAVQLVHPLGEIGIRRLNEQVIMVAHQTVGVQVLKELEAELATLGECSAEGHTKRVCQLRASGCYGKYIRLNHSGQPVID